MVIKFVIYNARGRRLHLSSNADGRPASHFDALRPSPPRHEIRTTAGTALQLSPHPTPPPPPWPTGPIPLFNIRMNTISPPPQIKRISAGKRVLGVVVGIAGGLGANALLAYSGMSFYTRNTKFVPYDTTHSDLTSALHKAHNPGNNPPGCIDHAIKQIPYMDLPEKYRRLGNASGLGARGGLDGGFTVDKAALTTDFCRGVWGGLAYRIQRRYLERKYRNLPGREGDLWDVKDLERSEYPVGIGITDHFEVVAHDDRKVSLR